MTPEERWVEVWRGSDDARLNATARRLDDEGIPMRIAATQHCGSGAAGFSLFSLFRRRPGSRLLVPADHASRARALAKQT